MDIPLLAARYTATTPDTSVTPDVQVTPSFAALAAGVDLEMQMVQGLVQQRRQQAQRLPAQVP